MNNAGISGAASPQPSTQDVVDIRQIFEVNVLGPIRVIQAFLPLLRKSQSARIVMVSSGMGSLSLTSDFRQPIWGVAEMGYSASKAALKMVTVKLAKKLLAEGIKVNAACPGSVATDFNPHYGIRTPEVGTRSAVRLATLDAMGPTGGLFHDGDGPAIAPYSW